MHELSITEELLALALKHARAAGAARITSAHLALGEMSSMTPESVSFYWDLISAGTPAEGATLTFRRVPAEFRCADCGHEGRVAEVEAACPACGSANVRLKAGDELVLEALDLDVPDGAEAAGP
jgi:hydrogenase nickel incorporation protein HypA/HybF